ncbi:MAG: MerR family transcriptional regulator [Gemmatimonadota bacterium]|nr:MAG: MerR family transcriptional regulator [Gemmatimonadota bacterium]
MANGGDKTKRHPIRIVARRTGLSRDVLRAWELRYGVVAPERTTGGQRLYSDADIERLRLIQEALEAGRRIGQLAELSSDELRRLVDEDRSAGAPGGSAVRAQSGNGKVTQAFLTESLAAVREMDAPRLEAILSRAAVAVGASQLIDHVITPLMIEIGALWSEDELTPGHERLATAVVRRTLDSIRVAVQHADGPSLVVATPAGQHHEIGALLAAAAAAASGWRVVYLGAELPAPSIATAVDMTGARAVALSIIFPTDDPDLPDELRSLRRQLSDEVLLIVGGRGVAGYRSVIEEIGALWLPDAPGLRAALDLVSATNGSDRHR